MYKKLHQISDSEAFFSERYLKQKLIEKYDNNTSEIGRKDVICFQTSLNKILREHLANKSENPEDSDGGSIFKVGGPKTNDQIFSPTTRAGSGVARNVKRRGGIISTFFFSIFSSAELI